MGIVEGGDELGIDDDLVVYDQIGNQGSDSHAFVFHWKLLLLIAVNLTQSEFAHECVLVELLIETRFQGVEHFEGRTDDLLRQFFMG